MWDTNLMAARALALGSAVKSVSSAAELGTDVEAFLASRQFAEVWVRESEVSAMSMLVNGAQAWLMHVINIDEECWQSVEPAYAGAPEATIEFRLSNGQLDEYPASWVVPTEQAIAALVHFFLTGERSPSLSWEQEF